MPTGGQGKVTLARASAALLYAAGACDLADAPALAARLQNWQKGGRDPALIQTGLRMGRTDGKSRTSVYVCRDEAYSALVWQPLHGGKRYHKAPFCRMDGPRLTTITDAQALGFSGCGNCY